MAEKKVSPDYAVGKVSDTLLCSICLMILHDPVQTPCQHIFCRDCIEGFIDTGDSPSCPNDRKELRKQDLRAAPLCLSQLLQEVELLCPEFGCGKTVKLDAFQGHRKSCRLETVVCEKGCQSELIRHNAASHDCIKELRIANRKLHDVIEGLREELTKRKRFTAEYGGRIGRLAKKLESVQQESSKAFENLNEEDEEESSAKGPSPIGAYGALLTTASNNASTSQNDSDSTSRKLEVERFARGTFYLKGSSNFAKEVGDVDLKSEVLSFGGVKWQIIVQDRGLTRYILKCHGMDGHSSLNCTLSTSIILKLIRNSGKPPLTMMFGRRTFCPDQDSTIFLTFMEGRGSWKDFAVESECLFEDGTVQMDVLLRDTYVGPDMMPEGELLFDFKGISKMEVGDMAISHGVTIGGLQWNLHLFKESSLRVKIDLLCNSTLEKRRKKCVVDYEIRVKARRGYAADKVLNVLDDLSLSENQYSESWVNVDFSNYVVDDTLSVAAKVKVKATPSS